MDVIEQIIAAQDAQLAKPTRAVVNSENAFVRQRLRNEGFTEAAELYWNFVCGQRKLITDQRVLDRYEALSAIDRQYTMPAWGTYGT